jgi:hypothetical protein
MADAPINSAKPSSDVIGEVAKRHGVLLDQNDPMAMVPTLVEMGFASRAEELMQAALRTMREEVRAELRREQSVVVPGAVVAPGPEVADAVKREADAIVKVIAESIQQHLSRADSVAATLVANVDQAHTRPARIRWAAIGMGLLVLAFGAGVVVGKILR